MHDEMASYGKCAVCRTDLIHGIQPWHFVCRACGYEASTLRPSINDAAAHSTVDEADREAGLRAIRQENFRDIIAMIEAAGQRTGRLLDVGSAHGWFLDEAASRFIAKGVEPDEYVAAKVIERGLNVAVGYFPDALAADEHFDIIVFNDVIEHIPDIHSAITACHERLNTNGLLVLNLPSSAGLFYRLSRVFSKIGWPGPFERLWQKGFPSPHVHYFTWQTLSRLVTAHGFELVRQAELPSVRIKGLLERVRYASNATPLSVIVQYVGALGVLPWTKAFPSDIVVCLFRKK